MDPLVHRSATKLSYQSVPRVLFKTEQVRFFSCSDPPSLQPQAALPAMTERLSLTQRKRLASARWEKRQLIDALERSGGNRSQTARLLGIDRSNLLRLLRKHGLGAR